MRTDIHRPSSPDFDPEAYDCWGVFDSHPEEGDHKDRRRVVSALVEEGYKFGHGGSTTCGHCGAAIRYGALMVHQGAKEFIFVGEECLANRFESTTKAEFQMLRKAAKLNRERATKKQVAEQTFADNPWLNECPTYGGDFLDSLYEQARAGKILSERQIEAGQKALAKAKIREEEFQARAAAQAAAIEAGVRCPEGKVTIRGEIVSVKWHENEFGGSLKMIVQSEEGFRVWSTVPRAFDGYGFFDEEAGGWREISGAQVGDQVEFSATVTPSNDDPLFGFAKRPTKAKYLARA